MKKNWQTPALIGAMAVGLALPQLHVLSFMVRYMMMVMLFLAFLNLKTENIRFHRSHLILLVVSPATAAAAYLCLRPFSADWALAGFLVALTPTATASPVITGLLGGDAAYPALMVLASSIVQPLLISATLPYLGGGQSVHGVIELMIPLLSTILIPFAVAAAVRRFLPAVGGMLKKYPSISFVLWVASLSIVSAVAFDFIFRSRAPLGLIVGLALVSLILCVFNFTIGRLIGGAEHRIEAGQSLGQKNTVFTIWVAMNFVNPMVALGPTFYILCHNAWNAFQLHKRNSGKPL